ncbi:MAG: flagellar basal-body MS-ring/collar protein FliF [Candidatus Weimeria sp.]
MPERIQNIFKKIVEWWKKFTSRQKALIISAVSVVAIALIILGVVATRPDKMTLVTATDATQAQSIKDLLDGENISYTQSEDGMTFTIDKKDEADATITLGQNGIYSNGYTGEKADDSYAFSNVVDGSFTTTESDKQRKETYWKQKQMEKYLETLSNVKDAQINLSVPDDDGTLAAKQEESSASVMLDLSDSMSDDQAAAIAKFVATGLGNKTTSNITIIDTDDNILFSGGDESTSGGIASSNLSAQQKKEKYVESKVKKILSQNTTGDAVYDNVQVAANLDMDFDDTETKNWSYSVASGQDQGYLDSQTTETSSSTGSSGGEPGTGSNSDVDSYVTTNNGTTSSDSEKTTSNYLPNETYTDTKTAAGKVNNQNSTITITAYNDVIYDEDQMKASGQLKNQTFDQFVASNSGMTSTKVSNSLIQAVSNATGIPTSNITINAYDVPQFHYSTGGRTWVDWLEIILAVLIFALLGFVAFRSLRGKKEEEQAEEVSVDTLLREQQQQDEQLEDIGYNEKSEARQLIEKFVDEKPEAAANLLRNWLNEDWGE